MSGLAIIAEGRRRELEPAAYSYVLAARRRSGRPTPPLDCMIAAIPVAHDAGVVTRDVGGFHEFHIGEPFWCAGQRWRCTDIGTRTIAAIKLDHDDDPSWYHGPPYAVAEIVFDEYDMEGCELDSDRDPENLTPTAESPPTLPTEADWDSPEDKARCIAQARALRDVAQTGGLRFDAYLPPRLADWLLGHIESDVFRDPSKPVFVMLGEQREMEPHADLRQESLKRSIQAAIDDPRPGIPAEVVFCPVEKMGREADAGTRPMAAEAMTRTLARSFHQHSVRDQDLALPEPGVITRNRRGCTVMVFVAEYERLERRDRQVLSLDDFTAADLAALEAIRAPEDARAFDNELNT